MIKLRPLTENISVNKKDKDKEIFDYSSLKEDAWRDIIKQAQNFQKIYFDLENNDSTGQKKTFYIKKNLRKDQPVKYEINAELYMAGGDWENPVMYFKIELTHDYNLKNNEYEKTPEYIWDLPSDYSTSLYKNYVIIPPIEAGNKLNKHGDKWSAFDADEVSEKDKKLVDITDADKARAWKWLGNLINDAVEKRHKMLDESASIKLKSLLEKKTKKDDWIPTTPEERAEANKKFGSDAHIFLHRDENGYFMATHRARSKSKESVSKIPIKDYKFICSTS